MIGRLTGWTVLALLAFSSAPKADAQVADLPFTTMTFSNDGVDTTTVVVCSDATIAAGTEIVTQLIVQNSGAQSSYARDPADTAAQCATFLIEDSANLLPYVDPTKYEVVVYADGVEMQSGVVIYAFPEGEIFDCTATATFGRFKDMDPSTVDVTQWLCLQPDAPSVCYLEINAANPNCLTGLDLDHPTFEVCTALTLSVATAIGPFSVVLTYTESGDIGTFTVTDDVTQGPPAELLHKVAPGATYSVSGCDGAPGCASPDFIPSPNYYDLCAVYTSTSGDVTNFGATTFQDLQLVVDRVTSTDVVDFHFKNLQPGPTYSYFIASDPAGAGDFQGPSFSLNCGSIAEGGTCNGFFDSGAAADEAAIAVSYDEAGTNTVIAQVPDS